MNLMVATKIMGWKFIGVDEEGENIFMRKEKSDGDEYEYFFPFSPITCMNQCMQVVEKMWIDGWQMHLFRLNADTRVSFYKSYEDWRKLKERDYSKASTPNEAILTAALKAKGVKVEQ